MYSNMNVQLKNMVIWMLCLIKCQENMAYSQKESHNISIEGDQFMLDGQPLHIVSGSLHYFRLPSAYWRDRLRKLKAAGLNSVSTYVEWSYHEPEERQYSFHGDRDAAKFIQTAAEEGLYVILRPGPYICAERDLGGLPYWLLGKYPNIKLRTKDIDFLSETREWFAKLFKYLVPLLYGNGGPVILIQIENEYGRFGSDTAYMQKLRNIFEHHVGNNALLFTTDGPADLAGGSISGVLSTITNRPGYENFEINTLLEDSPLMISEFYIGWLTHWREKKMSISDGPVITNSLRSLLKYKFNINCYMFFGGTNFEFSSGANFKELYQPHITSYDYDAPLNEAGDPTAKYYAIRKVLKEHNPHVKQIPAPKKSPKGAYGKILVKPRINLLSTDGRLNFGKKYDDVTGSVLPTFEQLRQRAGLVLYETTIYDKDGRLYIEKPRDRVYIYVDNELRGLIHRMSYATSIYITREVQSSAGSILSLLVENQGRINYDYFDDFKGILSPVMYNDKVLDGKWSVTGYPLQENKIYHSILNTTNINSGPILYSAKFMLPKESEILDSFLDPTGWGKGYIWINGHNLGRYWPSAGPQVTLYVPGVWLKAPPAHNRLQILELEHAPDTPTMEFIDYPILKKIE